MSDGVLLFMLFALKYYRYVRIVEFVPCRRDAKIVKLLRVESILCRSSGQH
jgi:hypothetical protein